MELTSNVSLICESALEKKAEDIVVMDMRPKSAWCSFFVVMSGPSTVRVKTIADTLEEKLGAEGHRLFRKEGYADGLWVLLDFGDTVAHVFHQDTRQYYDLEKLWGDAHQKTYLGPKL